MLAAFAGSVDSDAPLTGLVVGSWEPPPERRAPGPDWVSLTVRAATVNPHDLWTLRGAVRPRPGLPAVLGTDAAGVTADGDECIVHAVLGVAARGGGDETMDPDRITLPEAGFGTLAEQILVPRANLVPKPVDLGWAEAACLPTAWLTAYRMLFTRACIRGGDRIVVQGAGGGVATAAIALAAAVGAEVHVVSRTARRRALARTLGAHSVSGPDDRLPGLADVVVDSVGPATWSASIAALRPGGTLVTCGSATGFVAPTNLARVFSRQLRIVGSTMGTRDELTRLIRLLTSTGVRPKIDSIEPLSRAAVQFGRLEAGSAFGKLVIVP